MRHAAARPHREYAADALTIYLEEIAAYPLLTREQEIALAHRIAQGDRDALQQLVCSNLRFVVSIAKRFQNRGVPLADLINEGNVGLIRAAEKFDHTKGVKFISYAVWWIRQSMTQTLARCGQAVRLPLTPAGMQSGTATLSIDSEIGNGNTGRLLDYLRDDNSAAAPDEMITNAAVTNAVQQVLTHLSERETLILRLYFGFDGGEGMTLEEIGQQLGVTRERVRQLKQRALARLRRRDGELLATLR